MSGCSHLSAPRWQNHWRAALAMVSLILLRSDMQNVLAEHILACAFASMDIDTCRNSRLEYSLPVHQLMQAI